MYRLSTAVLISTLSIGSVYAQSPASSGATPASDEVHHAMQSDAGHNDAGHNMDVQKHVEGLHAKLKITPAEEPLWSAVAQTMIDNASHLDEAIDKREQADSTAVQDLAAYGDVIQAHADGIKKLSAVFSPLYAAMSVQQKSLADEVFAQSGHPGKNQPQTMK